MTFRTAGRRRFGQSLGAVLAAVALLLGLVPPPPAGAAAVPAGWQLAASETLGLGVEHQTLRSSSPAQ